MLHCFHQRRGSLVIDADAVGDIQVSRLAQILDTADKFTRQPFLDLAGSVERTPDLSRKRGFSR